jgi:hypothetical protein
LSRQVDLKLRAGSHFLHFLQNGEAYAKIFMILLARVQRAEYLQYIITLLDDLVQGTERKTNRNKNRH